MPEQTPGFQPKDVAPGAVVLLCGRRNGLERVGEGDGDEPHGGGGEAGDHVVVGVQHVADDRAGDHPAKRGPHAHRAEL